MVMHMVMTMLLVMSTLYLNSQVRINCMLNHCLEWDESRQWCNRHLFHGRWSLLLISLVTHGCTYGLSYQHAIPS